MASETVENGESTSIKGWKLLGNDRKVVQKISNHRKRMYCCWWCVSQVGRQKKKALATRQELQLTSLVHSLNMRSPDFTGVLCVTRSRVGLPAHLTKRAWYSALLSFQNHTLTKPPAVPTARCFSAAAMHVISAPACVVDFTVRRRARQCV